MQAVRHRPEVLPDDHDAHGPHQAGRVHQLPQEVSVRLPCALALLFLVFIGAFFIYFSFCPSIPLGSRQSCDGLDYLPFFFHFIGSFLWIFIRLCLLHGAFCKISIADTFVAYLLLKFW